MSDEEEQDTMPEVDGPLDAVSKVEFGLLLDDQHRRQSITNLAYRYKTTYDEEGKPEELTIEVAEPAAAALYAHALSTQVNLLDLDYNMARAAMMEMDIIFMTAGLKYRRTKHRIPLSIAQSAFNNTINGMSTNGTFSLWLAKMSGSIRELITGVRKGENKDGR